MELTIKNIIKEKRRKAIPIMTNPGIELIGEIVKNAVTDGIIHYKAIKAVSDRYGSAACTVIMDLTVEAEAFGAEIVFPEDEVPSVIGRLLTDAAAVEELEVPELTRGRIPQYILANRLAAENITDKPVLSGCIGPFSLAGRLYDMSEIMLAIYLEPDTVNALLQKCTRFLIRYCQALKDTGTSGVIIAEPAAGLLRNEDCLMYSTEFVKQIVDAVQDDGFIVVLHNCGNTGNCTDAMVKSGAKALHFGNKIDMVKALQDCPSDIIVMGNIDPVSILKQASPEEVYKETRELLDSTGDCENFILSSGCDVPPFVPHENIIAFFEALNEYNNSL